MTGRFEGDVIVKFLEDGRIAELQNDLIFIDPAGVRWGAPKGAQVDGASIPKGFWSLIGGPFEGKYRDASIIHDWFCDQRTRTWQATHRVFYDGMIARGVDPLKAKLMYYAVRWGGPRWEARVSHNTKLDVGDDFKFGVDTQDGASAPRRPRTLPSPGRTLPQDAQEDVAQRMQAFIEANADVPLDALEGLAEQESPPAP